MARPRLARLPALGVCGWLFLVAANPGLAQDKPLPPSLAIVPQDAFAFVHLRPADIWQSEPCEKLRQLYPDQANFIKDVIEEFACHPVAGIDSISFVYPTEHAFEFTLRNGLTGKKNAPAPELPPNQWHEMIVVSTTTPLDRARILRVTFGDRYVTEKHKDKTYFTAKDTSAVHFVDERTCMFVTPSYWMKDVLAQPIPKTPGSLSSALDLAVSKCAMVIGLNLTESISDVKRLMKQLTQDPKSWWLANSTPLWLGLFDQLLEARSAIFAATVDKNIRVQANIHFANEARAAAAEEQVEVGLKLLRILSVTKFAQSYRRQAVDADTPLDPIFWSLVMKQADRLMRDAVMERRQSSLQIVLQGQFDVDALRTRAQEEVKELIQGEAYREAQKRRQNGRNLRKVAP